MVLKAKLVIVCNNIIEIPGMDAAIRRRISVIPFTSTFLDQSEYKYRAKKGILEQNSNIIDLSVEKELLSCTKAFMYVLSRRYREWVSRDRMLMETPAAIKSVTEDYVTRHNYHLKFIRHYLRSVVGSSFAAAEMYESFKEWFKKSYPGKRLVDFDVFTKEMSEEGYKDNGNGIILDVFMIYNGE
jgi:phage/plasmid-associated DNA primase